MSVYTTYCGLTSCTVLVTCWSPGFEGEGEVGEEEVVGKRVEVVGQWELASSQVPEEVPGRSWSDSSP